VSRLRWGLLGLSIAFVLGAAAFLAVGASSSSSPTGGSQDRSEAADTEEEWLQYVESWEDFVRSKEDGTIVEDEGSWKELCYIDDNGVHYTYDNVSLSDLSDEMKRWCIFEGSMPCDIRQLLLTRYYLFMTDEERESIWRTVTCAEFLEGYLGMSEEERKAIWDSIIWNKTIPAER